MTLGTNIPVRSLGIPAGDHGNLECLMGSRFANGIKVAETTTAIGLTAQGNNGRLQLRVQIKKIRAVWIATLILLVATSASAGMMLLLRVGKSLGGGDRYTPLCSVGSTCIYAYSTEHQMMVSTATTALQVAGSVDGTTQNVSFARAGFR